MAGCLNLLLGLPGLIPVWLLWYLAANWPLAAVGWTEREATENDGVLPWLLVAGPVVALFTVTWWLINRSLQRWTALPPLLHWPVNLFLTLAPSFMLMVIL